MKTTAPQAQTLEENQCARTAQRGSDVHRFITESTFAEVPEGAEFRLRAVSFLKLLPGDFILVSSNRGYLVRRFLGVSKRSGNTRLVVMDGDGAREELPFVRLLGLVYELKEKDSWINPNAINPLRRARYALYGWFAKNKPAA